MTKIVHDDGREEEINLDDFINKADLDDNYVSKEDYDALQEKYEKKSKQAKEAFKNKDLAGKQALSEEGDRLRTSIRDEIKFTTKHGFDEIPEEVIAAKEKHPTLSWEEALAVSGYKEAGGVNTNPGREDTSSFSPEKKSYSMEELAELSEKSPELYNRVAEQIENGEVKQI